ncbi:MAG: hypothetical protein K0S01_286 [Herbinix sp.]|jgi:hypothetical protein|nr:hypothetical protein [Herbinix sp.]
MKNKLIKYKKTLIIPISLLIALSVAGFTGCDFKQKANSQVEETSGEQLDTTQELPIEDSSTNESTQELETKNDTETGQETDQEADQEADKDIDQGSEEATDQGSEEASNQEVNQEDKNITQLISLIGLSKEALASTLDEASRTVDEGGLEFTDYGIRVWFDENSLVNQIYLMNNDFNLNNVKIGDKISKFKEVFGDPVSDNNGDAHFQYENIFLSVNYDTTTKETFAVYLLKNDF